jgi:hypothetical protein
MDRSEQFDDSDVVVTPRNISDMTIDQIMSWVGDSKVRRDIAFDLERNGKARKTLLARLSSEGH